MPSRRSRLLATVAASCAATGLVACASSGPVGSPSGTTQPTDTTVEAPSKRPTPTVPPSILPRSGEVDHTLTKPGTKLELGEPAYLKLEGGRKGQDSYVSAIVEVTVNEIRTGTAKDFANLKNAADFADHTPYYLESTNRILAFEGNRHTVLNADLDPIGEGRIGSLIAFNFDACTSTSYSLIDPIIGATREPCQVTAGVDGGTVTGAKYNGESSSSPYYKRPVTWGTSGG